MLNPIKRVWVPKPRVTPEVQSPAAPDTTTSNAQSPQSSSLRRGVLYDELPEPDVEEKTSDSVWAAFDPAISLADKSKPK